MSFESELKTHLSVAAVTEQIGDRLHPVRAPEGVTKPTAIYQRIAGEPRNSLDGFTSGLTHIRLQISVWAATFDAARAAADAIAARMNTATATLSSVLILDEDDYEPDTKLFRIIQEFSCWHRQ